ncbi:MAG: PilW family protein [Burkholderiaceae bacterium]
MNQRRAYRREDGATLIELMISLVIALILLLTLSALLLGSLQSLRTQDGASVIEDRGRFAVDTMARIIRLGGYVNWPGDERNGVKFSGRAVHGVDGRQTGTTAADSDTLTVRYLGSAIDAAADRTIFDCAGAAVPADGNPATVSTNVFRVINAELTCAVDGGEPQPLIAGVERLHFLYGVDRNDDGIPDTYQRASEVSAWNRVLAVKVALLLAGETGERTAPDDTIYVLLSDGRGSRVTLDAAALNAADRSRLRRQFNTTVVLRN